MPWPSLKHTEWAEQNQNQDQRAHRGWTHTYEVQGPVQPGQNLLAEGVVDGNPQEVGFWDEVRFGAGVAGVQDEGDVVLLHQLLQQNRVSAGSEPRHPAAGQLLTLFRTSLWQPKYKCGRIRVGPRLETAGPGWDGQDGTRTDFPSHRPGNSCENS